MAKLFDRKADAVRWKAEQLAARERGDCIDPRDGRVTFTEFYANLVGSTGVGVDDRARFEPGGTGPSPTSNRRIRRSHIETRVKTMTAANLASGTIKTRHNNARAVFRAAVRDRFIATDPTVRAA